MMGISHKYVNSSAQNFIFRAEVTVKNDRVGLSLGSIGQYIRNASSVGGSYSFDYFLILLEKNDSGNGQIKGGYGGKDSKISNYLILEKKIRTGGPAFRIAPPGEQPGIDASKSRKLPTNTFQKDYFGLWESTQGSEGSEIFQDIQLWDTRKSDAEILGRENMEFKSDQYGYKSADYEYLSGQGNSYYQKNENQEVGSGVDIDITNSLNDWYKPFRNRRGRWRRIEKYCEDESGNRNAKEGDEMMATIKDFCYKKTKSA